MLLPPKLACDFLGKKLAGVLGLDAAKYQYAIDQYHRNHKVNIQRNKTHCKFALVTINEQQCFTPMNLSCVVAPDFAFHFLNRKGNKGPGDCSQRH